MPKWGKCDFRELENLPKRMEKLEKEQDAFCRKCAQELAARLLYLVGKRTPVGTIPEDAVEDEKIAQQWDCLLYTSAIWRIRSSAGCRALVF